MFSYTTSAALSGQTTYSRVESNEESYADITAAGGGGGGQTFMILADGGQQNDIKYSGSEEGRTSYDVGFAETYRNGQTYEAGGTTNADGAYTRTWARSRSAFWGYGAGFNDQSYTNEQNGTEEGGSTSASGQNNEYVTNWLAGEGVLAEPPVSNSFSGTWTVVTSQAKQTSTTTTYEYFPATTKKKTLYNKKGTTTAAGTITFPTTTETSWTEIAITNTTKTKTFTVGTTASENAHRSAITAHTIIHVAAGEILYTLKQSPNIGTPFTGTENWQSIQGPNTITISRWPCTTYQCEVLDASVDPYDSNATDTSSTKTVTVMNGVETANITQFYKTTEGLPLGSTSFEGAGSKISTTSETYVDFSSLSPSAATSQRIAVAQTATHNVNIGGVAFPVNGKAETTNVTVVVPVVRSASGDGGGFTEAGNFFVFYGVHNLPNNGGISDAYLRRAYAWATVGDGTSATADPKKSWDINGVSKVTWGEVSVSDGVATPWPAFGVETTSTTTSTAENQTASTVTATATTAIWGNVYRRKTSSSNSSGVTSSVKTTQLAAGGNGHTMLELGGLPALPTPAYIPSPVGSVLPVFGAAHIDDERTVIILPAEYANSTVTAPETFSGSTLTETYFETKSPPQIVLEGQGGAVQHLESLW